MASKITNSAAKFVVIGAGINGLVAANYLRRAGHDVTLLESRDRVGGACVSSTAEIDGVSQDYALGASTLGLMQDFVWKETGLAERLQIWPVSHPDLFFFPGEDKPTRILANESELVTELANRWDERGDVTGYYADEGRVVRFLQDGYRKGSPPSLERTEATLGKELTQLWITGSAQDLLDHYFTADKTKLHVAMSVSESGPVSVHEPYSAFVIPMMASGSVFEGGVYGYVKGGIWRITEELGRINQEAGVKLHLNCSVDEVDTQTGVIRLRDAEDLHFDHVVFATDPQTAARLVGDESLTARTGSDRTLGTAGKLNLMFRNPIRWKDDCGDPESGTAFRYIFAVDTMEEFDKAALAVTSGMDYAPGYYQIYGEGASMRQMGFDEPFERIAVFFKNLALGKSAAELAEVEKHVKDTVLSYIDNAEDCAWSRMLSPRDLQQTFGFPGGNIEHTMLVAGQSYDGRNYSGSPQRRFYQLGEIDIASICGSSTYPCGSVAGTPAYMCVHELEEYTT